MRMASPAYVGGALYSLKKYKYKCDREHQITENFVMMIVISAQVAYNKSVIIMRRNSNKNVKECIYGTIDFE